MIDHGYAFNGPNWDFPESPLQGLYAAETGLRGRALAGRFSALARPRLHFPEEVIDQAWKSIPPDWIEGEEDALEQLLERLFERRKRVPELIEACRAARADPFPNWR